MSSEYDYEREQNIQRQKDIANYSLGSASERPLTAADNFMGSAFMSLFILGMLIIALQNADPIWTKIVQYVLLAIAGIVFLRYIKIIVPIIIVVVGILYILYRFL